MSWSLQLHNGDFTAASAQLGTVTDEPKLVQDLRCALLEPMGTDSMHAAFGSVIDGGILPDGTVVPSLIASTDWNAAAASVQSEITRIAQNYQNQQLDRARSDRLIYNRISLSPGEVLLSISNLQLTGVQDSLNVIVSLTTARGEDLTLIFPLPNS